MKDASKHWEGKIQCLGLRRRSAPCLSVRLTSIRLFHFSSQNRRVFRIILEKKKNPLLWAAWDSRRCPCSWGGTSWALRSLKPKPFCDCMINSKKYYISIKKKINQLSENMREMWKQRRKNNKISKLLSLKKKNHQNDNGWTATSHSKFYKIRRKLKIKALSLLLISCAGLWIQLISLSRASAPSSPQDWSIPDLPGTCLQAKPLLVTAWDSSN